MPSRRDTLAGLAALATLALRAGAARAAPGPLWLSCRTAGGAEHQVAGFDAAGTVRFALPLPARGHAMALHPTRDETVVFARRPGAFAVVLAPERGLVIRRFDTPPDRDFGGHGAFDPTGRLLIATENDRHGPQGRLGVYDATDGYRRIAELPSHGIEPHQVVLMPDGNTLAAANGGIVTGGPNGRDKLNLDAMESSLAYIELASGKLIGAGRLPPHLRQLSIRHAAATADGRLAIGMQWEGPDEEAVPLVGIDDGSGIRLLPMPLEVADSMAHYVGSVAFDDTGRIVAASCPRGGTITFWDVEAQTFLASVPLADGCGVAPGPRGGFILSAGTGRLVALGPDLLAAELPGMEAGVAWDNHLARHRPA